MEFEAEIIKFIQEGISQNWTLFFKIISLLGSWVGLIIVFLCFVGFSWKYAITFLGTYGFGVGINYLIKLIVSRPRPFETYETIYKLTDFIGNSFPSGHAVSATIISVFVIYFVYKKTINKIFRYSAIFLTLNYALLVYVSRMYLGVHYITDLLAGICVGILVCALLYHFYKELKKVQQNIKE